MTKTIKQGERVFKRELAGVIILGIILLGVVVLSYYVIIENPNDLKAILSAALLFLLFGGILLNYVKTEIVIDDYSLTYKSLLKNRSLTFGEVVKIETSAKIAHVSGRGASASYNTILYLHNDKLKIPIKAFSRKSLKEFATILINKCPTADIDHQTRIMGEGKLPSVFFKNQ